MDEAAGASNPLQLLRETGRLLDAEGVRWAAIGALAVAYHGWIRASLDADALITLRGSSLDLEGLAARLREAGLKVEVRVGDNDDPLGFVLRLEDRAGNQVDLIGGIRRLDAGFFDRIIEDALGGSPLKFASAEDLVALKVFAGSAKDMEDAAGVVEILGPSLDQERLIGLCRGFGPEEESRCRKLLETGWS